MKTFNSLVLVTFFLFSNPLNSQDYLPLKKDHSWKYNIIINDGQAASIIDSFRVTVLEIDTIDAPGGLIIYKMDTKNSFGGDLNYFYTFLADPNTIYQADDLIELADLDCSDIFQHSFTTGDTLQCGRRTHVPTYYGSYTTLEGLTFNDCWTIHEVDSNGETEDYTFLAPNVGVVAFRPSLDDFPQSELSSWNFLSNNSNGINDIQLVIFPNPTAKYLSINSESNFKLDQIYLCDYQGKILMTSTNYDGKMIDVSALANGNYMLIGQSKNRIVFRESFVKVE